MTDRERLVFSFFNLEVMRRYVPDILQGFVLTVEIAVAVIVTGLLVGLTLAVVRSLQVRPVNWAIVLCLNPDARARMPNSFVGLSVKDVLDYDAGLRADGERNDRRGDVSPEEMMILGGLYNDAGVDILRHAERSDTVSPEREAVLNFIGRTKPRVCLELHAHCAAPQFYCPLTPTPAEVISRQVEAIGSIVTAGRAAGYEFADSTGEVQGLSTALYWEVGGAVPMLLESPQGVLDAGPRWDHARIIDVNLFVCGQLVALAQ